MRDSKYGRGSRQVACIALILLGGVTAARAADRFWVGPAGGLWSAPANWSATPGGPGGAGPPQVGDAAIAPDSGISATFDFAYSQPGIGLSLGNPSIEQNDASSALFASNSLFLPRFQQPVGIGQWTQTAGTNSLNQNLYLGFNSTVPSSHTQGFYTLSGNATLSIASSLQARHGTFAQADGFCTISNAELGDSFGGTPGGIAMSGGSLNIGGISQNFGASTFSGGNTTIGAGGISINTGSVTLSGGALSAGLIIVDSLFNQFVQNGGALVLPGRITVRETSFYRYNAGSLSAGSLDIQNGGQFVMAPGANKVAKTKGIVTTGTGKVDLADNAATADYTGASPLASIRSQIVSAQNGGSWNGSGIGSSFANSAQRGIGYAEASTLSSIPAIFGTVDSDTILIRLARYGDADLSGTVNLDDFNRLAANFGSGDVWTEGDFNYDGTSNLTDFNMVAANFGLSASPGGPTPGDWAALATVVPEPGWTSAIAAAFASVTLLPRLRHRKSITC